MDYLIHSANVIYIFSYLVRDILWLRTLIVVAISCVIPYYYFQPTPLMAPVYWNLVFASINIVQIVILLRERRPVQMSEDEQTLYKMIFRSLTPREAQKLFKRAHWLSAQAGDTLVQQDSELDSLMLIYRGRASVQVNGHEIATLDDGHFVGEMSYITGNKTSACVVACAPTRYLTWPKRALQPFLDKNTDLRSALTTIIGVDLARKLGR